MKKRKTKTVSMVTSAILTSIVLLSGCSPSDPNAQKTKSTPQVSKEEQTQTEQERNQETIQAYLKEQQDKMKALNEELNYYKQYVKDVTLTLPEDKLNELVEKEWSYSLTINNIEFPSNGIIEIKDKDFELVLSEERAKYSVLPEEESIKGKISNELKDSLKISSDEEVTTKEDTTDNLKKLLYSLKGAESDTVINITISEDLATKLEMNTTALEIRVQ